MKISTATTAELLSFFNANTGGAQVKKFADRKTAERRCQALADEMFIETQALVTANPDYQQAAQDANHYVRPSGAPITSRPAMVATMKIDRQIVSVHSGIVYKNACQVWKAGLVSASQGDRLSAVLYGAAKQGNRLMSLTLNGHLFALAVK